MARQQYIKYVTYNQYEEGINYNFIIFANACI